MRGCSIPALSPALQHRVPPGLLVPLREAWHKEQRGLTGIRSSKD